MKEEPTDGQERIVRLDDVHKSFTTDAGPLEVLRDVTLGIDRSESLAILGASGSGKSTLLSLIAGLDVPTSGSVHVDGIDLTHASEQELAAFRSERIGIVFQHFHLLGSLTAAENVALPLELRDDGASARSARDAALGTLETVGLGARAEHLPAQLSGGEAQRVAIARAIVTQPALLVADEPTGNLDSRTGAAVMDLLFDVAHGNGTTLVLVTHSSELAGRCDRRVVISDGRLADD